MQVTHEGQSGLFYEDESGRFLGGIVSMLCLMVRSIYFAGPTARHPILKKASDVMNVVGKGFATAGICGALLTTAPQCEAREIRC